MNLIYCNSEQDISLYSKGFSAFYQCDKCGKKLRSVGIEFAANNKEKSRYELPKKLKKEHECEVPNNG